MKEYYTKGEILFFVAYIMYFAFSAFAVTKVITLTPISGILKYLQILAAVIAFFKIISEEQHDRKSMVIYLIVFVILLCSGINSGDIDMLISICFMIAMKDISYKNILKISTMIQVSIMIITALAIWNGAIENETLGNFVWQETVVGDSEGVRFNLGYVHPNTISSIVLFTTLMYMCIRKKCSVIEFVLCFLINYIVYQNTGSRTNLIMLVIFIPLMFWFLNKKRIQQYWKVLLVISPTVIAAIAMFMQIFYDETNEVFLELNEVLSSRLSLGHQAFLDYGITPFGQKITWVGEYIPELQYNYVDCSYMRFCLDSGIIFLILVLLASVLTMYRLIKSNERGLCIAFLAVLVHGMIEPTMFSIAIQPFYLLLGQRGKLDVNNAG